jgi:hypothetical protein
LAAPRSRPGARPNVPASITEAPPVQEALDELRAELGTGKVG